MANFTPNVNLEKPLGSEHYLIPKFNANMDKIDTAVGARVVTPTALKDAPVDTDVIVVLDSEALNVPKKLTWAYLRGSLAIFFENIFALVLHGHAISDVTGLQTALDVKVNNNGWNLISATLTYVSADSPTFVVNTSIDLTSVISVGMKLKLTQTTVKYFIVTAITSTTITLYGGTDYTLTNATITLPYFSSVKSPFGFPLSEAKWTVSQEYPSFTLLPVNDTWLNIGNYNFNVPIGNWKVRYSVGLRSHVAAINGNYSNVYFGLSTSPTSPTNNDLMVGFGDDYGNSANEIYIRQINLTKNGNFIASSKTTLYLIFKINDYVVLIGASNGITNAYSPIKVELVCAYL